MAWPPSPQEFYLEAPPERPTFQGDVFEDVPFVKAKGGASAASDPTIEISRRHVATILYPCDMYATQGALNRVQAVAVVKPAEGITIPDDWSGAYSLCPLPDLLGDGRMWVADFARLANIDRSFLTPEKRVRCLSETGWTIFRMRLLLATTRVTTTQSDFERVGRVTWQEAALESEWCSAARDGRDFQAWLDESDPNLGGFSRRKALERGQHTAVQAALIDELAA